MVKKTQTRKWVPPANHPWREAARRAIEEQACVHAIIVGLALRFALNTPPCGLRRASLPASPTNNKRRSKNRNEKGDISNELIEGTSSCSSCQPFRKIQYERGK
jgi:hypothetical protein